MRRSTSAQRAKGTYPARKRWRRPSWKRLCLAGATLVVLTIALMGGAQVSDVNWIFPGNTRLLSPPRVVGLPQPVELAGEDRGAVQPSLEGDAAAQVRARALEQRCTAVMESRGAGQTGLGTAPGGMAALELNEAIPEEIWNQHEPILEEPEFAELVRSRLFSSAD